MAIKDNRWSMKIFLTNLPKKEKESKQKADGKNKIKTKMSKDTINEIGR